MDLVASCGKRMQPALIGIALALLAGCQSAAPSTGAAPAERAQMAAVHERVARCLRSDQPLGACQDIMRKHCESMKAENCGMMGMSQMHGGMGSKDDKALGGAKDGQHQH